MAEEEGCYWYPQKPDDAAIATPADITPVTSPVAPTDALIPPRHPIWESGALRYTNSNIWSRIRGLLKEGCRRHSIHGAEVRTLPPNHPLHGEEGLFATKAFEVCDIIGEYTGRVVGPEVLCGHYLATLEDKEGEDSLGLDAQHCGNEMRFINSYLNVQFYPNVTMRTAYINSYPHILIVASRPIDVGDEILLDYGKAYNDMYLTKKEPMTIGGRESDHLTYMEGRAALPGTGDDSSSDDDDNRSSDS